MLYSDDIINMRIYRKPFILPLDMKNKKFNSSVLLLTPNYESTVQTMKNPLLIPKYYESYYIEKDISLYISNEENALYSNNIGDDDDVIISESSGSVQIYYSGNSYDVGHVSRIINANYVKTIVTKYKVDIKKPMSVVIYPLLKEETPSCTTSAVNIASITHTDDKAINYEKYIKFCMVKSIILNINPDANKKLIDGVCCYETEYAPYPDAKTIAKLVEQVVKKQGLSKLIHIIKKDRWMDLVETSIHIHLMDKVQSTKLFTVMTEAKIEVPDAASLARRIKRRNRKSIYAHNAVKRAIEDQSGGTPTEPTTANSDNRDTEEEGHEEEKISEATSISGLQFIDEQIAEDFIKMDDTMILFEGDDQILKKIIWSERLRTNKDVLAIYDRLKEDVPFIKRTFFNYERYKNRNLFIDLSFYNKTFFKNNIYKLDRAINLYYEFLNRLINDRRIAEAGYGKKFVIIPVNDWDNNPSTKMWMYSEDINPISVFYRLIMRDFEKVKTTFKDIDFLFLTDKGYFKLNFNEFEKSKVSKFLTLIKRLRIGDVEEDLDVDKDSAAAMAINVVEKIEKGKGIKIDNISAITKGVTTSKTDVELVKSKEEPDEDSEPIKNKESDKGSDSTKTKPNKKETPEEEIAREKNELVENIVKAAERSLDEDDVIDNMDEDEKIKEIILNLSAQEGNDVGINAARNARITQLQDDLLKKEIQGKSIRDMIEEGKDNTPIPKTTLNIDTVNDEFKDLTFTNFDKNYDINEDIVAMLHDFANKSMPVSVRDIKIEDTSTSEDFIDTYTVQMEDFRGKRFSLVFDVPKFKNDKYMILRGNKKSISNQLFLIPALKTDINTAQIITNYKKIFVRTFGTTSGKSFVTTSKIMKVINKKDIKSISHLSGDNTRICNKYELPIDYIDFASVYSFIDIDANVGHYKFYFNQDKIREDYPKVNEKEGIPVAIFTDIKGSKSCLYYKGEDTFSNFLHEFLLSCKDGEEYADKFNKTAEAVRYTYSKASIMSTEIPLVIVAAYSEGLTKVMKKAGVKYELSEKRPKLDPIREDLIKFKDGYIKYELNYNSSLLMNGLKAVNLSNYSLSDINSKIMYTELLDFFGGRLIGDGLDNFYDLMIDPITASIIKKYKLPEDYVSLLLYTNKLLADNKYVKHTNQTVRRARHKEIIAACAYDCLSRSYGDYRTALKHGKDVAMTIKKSAVIDRVMNEPAMSDLSILNPLLEIESYNSVSTKGISGLNSDRSYSLDKRGYDETMNGVMGMSTGFAVNVGITRQMSIDANIDGKRGYIKPGTKDDGISVTKSLAMTEALTPFGTTHDDPFRTAMTFVQTSKHSVRTVNSDPLLISNGADEALPYLISDTFAFKSKDTGTVVYKDDSTMIVEYKNGEKDYINLEESTEKNSNGGFFVTIKLDTDLKVGSKFKNNEILAYDKTAFSDKVGAYGNIAYNLGKLTKIAILQTDEGYEDSTFISEKLSNDLSSEQVLCKDINLDKDASIFNLVKIGDKVEEGSPLMIIQSSYDEEDANRLVKNLMTDNENDVTEFGRKTVKAPITGVVQNIVIYRTCEIEDMSPALQKIVKAYEKDIKAKKKILESYGIKDNSSLNADYKLPNVGKLKNVIDGVKIEIYVKYLDKFSVGDKLINYSALKGVSKGIIPKGLEPTSEFNPQEKINILLAVQSVNGRMVCSIILNVTINKFLIELDRENKKTLGIPIDYEI